MAHPGPDARTADASQPPSPDAPERHPVTVTLAETSDTVTITAGNSHACHYTPGGTAENHYYRAFRLSELGVTGALDIESVSFGVEVASAPTGTTQPGQMRIYKYNNSTIGAALVESDMEQLATKDITIPNAPAGYFVTVPIAASVPAGATFIVEVFSPNHADATTFRIGTNTSTQTRPGYVKMPLNGCDVPTPQTTDSVGFTSMAMLITVTGKTLQ